MNSIVSILCSKFENSKKEEDLFSEKLAQSGAKHQKIQMPNATYVKLCSDYRT